MDLFYWLADAIIKEYPSMGDKNIQDIFQLGKTEVVFDGETMQMDDYIKISTTNQMLLTVSPLLHS